MQAKLNENIDRSIEDIDFQEEETFQWTKQWYPVAVVDFLDRSRPHKIELLGYDMPALRKISTQEGFSFAVTTTDETIDQAVHDFQPPCHMRIAANYRDGGKLILALYAIPTRPGWCRHIGCQVFVKNDAGKMPKGLGFFALPMPVWLGHILASLFLHQDLVFLHYQEKILARRQQNWLDAVYTPNPQDKMVITFRQWLKNRAGGSIPWYSASNAEFSSSELDKRQLFDVWETHTKNCVVCQKALKKINRLKLLSYIGAVACSFLAIAIDARAVAYKTATTVGSIDLSFWQTIPPTGFWIALAAAIILAIVGYLLQKLSRLFYVYEFEHSRND
jgi:phenylpropionate dioxygenase-like ring-hydroxylating dioxygenase large terminal subunit